MCFEVYKIIQTKWAYQRKSYYEGNILKFKKSRLYNSCKIDQLSGKALFIGNSVVWNRNIWVQKKIYFRGRQAQSSDSEGGNYRIQQVLIGIDRISDNGILIESYYLDPIRI